MNDSSINQSPQTLYADKKGDAIIVCPSCGYAKPVNAFKAGIVRKKTKVRCKCGHTFKFIIEIRTIYRKEVKLTGQCKQLRNNKTDVIQIADISQSGIGFKHPSPTDISKGDRLQIAFRLDNSLQSKVNLRVEVTRIDNNFIGAEFIKPWHEPALLFYLQT